MFLRFLPVVSLLCVLACCQATVAAEPAPYIILRPAPVVASPARPIGAHGSRVIVAPARPYAYGYFGATPRRHGYRHSGYYRNFIQWTFR